MCDLKKAVGRKHSRFGLEDIATSRGCYVHNKYGLPHHKNFSCSDTVLKAPVLI